MAIRNWMVKLEIYSPSLRKIENIIGIMPSRIISMRGYLEKETRCKMPNTGLRHRLSSRYMLKIPTKF